MYILKSLKFYEYLCKQWEDSNAFVAKGVDEPSHTKYITNKAYSPSITSLKHIHFFSAKEKVIPMKIYDLICFRIKKNPTGILRYNAMLNASFPQVTCFNFLWKLNFSMVKLSIKTCFVCIFSYVFWTTCIFV